MYKAGRTLATKTINFNSKDKADEMKKKLNETLLKYNGDTSLDDYLAYRMVELDSTDPNSFIVTELPGEYDPNDPKAKIEPYPFEVNSSEAINYLYKNNELQFLIVLGGSDKRLRYTIYLENEAIVAEQVSKEELNIYLAKNPKAEIIYKDPQNKSDNIFVLTVALHKAGRIPAIRIGTKKDLYTRNRTCVPLIHPARSFLKKSIKTISEFDLTTTLHVFPQKITYDAVCPGDVTSGIICQNGKTTEGKVCSICNGSGFNEHKSSQDVIRVKMPNDLSEIKPLENFIAYKNPPTDILDFMKKLGLYEFPELAVQAVYTSELFSTDQVVKTATEKSIDLESIYDALKPFTDQWSKVYKHTAYVVAAYLSIASNLTLNHVFPKDFKMKPLSDLLDDLNKANTGNAPSYIKKEINKDIAQKIYVDKPDELLKIEVKEKFFPFSGKSESEISTIILNNLTTKFNQVLYANYDVIFDELEQENTTDLVSFYKMDAKAQKDLIAKKVEQYVAIISEESSAGRAELFNGAGDGAVTNGDSQDYNIGDSVALSSDPTSRVEIISANVGPNGGSFKIKLQDGSEKEVSGNDLTDF